MNPNRGGPSYNSEDIVASFGVSVSWLGEIGAPGLLAMESLNAPPSEISADYVSNKKQFQLHELLTEQRHPKTFNLSQESRRNPEEALRQLFSVDDDISLKFNEIVSGDGPTLDAMELAVSAIYDAIINGRRIYVYGCGATGRLAKQMESTFWRPFWRTLRTNPELWSKVCSEFSHADRFEDMLVGEMTGADRALISSLEGFEDLQVIGTLQLEQHGISADDVVICVTEGLCV